MHDDYDVEAENGGADPVWRTKDERQIRVSKMTNEHVLNAGRYCRRAAAVCLNDALAAGSYATTAPDGASMAAESESNALVDQACRLLAWAGYFDKVALERGLTPREEREPAFNAKVDE